MTVVDSAPPDVVLPDATLTINLLSRLFHPLKSCPSFVYTHIPAQSFSIEVGQDRLLSLLPGFG